MMISEDEDTRVERRETEVASGASGPRILVVEDEAHLADGVRFNLEQEGYIVEVVESGRVAVDRLADGDQPAFDLVLLDLMLPEMSGFEVARRTRASGNYGMIPPTSCGGSKKAQTTT